MNVPALRFPEFDGEWEDKRLRELLRSHKLGGNYANSLEPTARPLIKMGNLKRGKMDVSKVEYIDSGEKVDPDDLVKSGDLFFNTRNTLDLVGKVAIWSDELPVAYYNSNLMRLEFECTEFMNLRLNTHQGVKSLKRVAAGTTSVAAIYTKDLLGVKTTVPSFPEQKKIAAFLGVVDAKIAALRAWLKGLERYKRGLMQALFSQTLRFTKPDGSAFPDWKEMRASELFASMSNKKHDGDLPILAITQEGGAVLREDIDIDIKATSASVLSYKIVEPGDFIISLRSFQGGIEYSGVLGICSPAYTILKPMHPISDGFFQSYLKDADFISRLSATVVGIRDGKQISYSAFSTLVLPYPHPDEQVKIAEALSAMDAKIAAVTEQFDQMQVFKKGLLQQMFV